MATLQLRPCNLPVTAQKPVHTHGRVCGLYVNVRGLLEGVELKKGFFKKEKSYYNVDDTVKTLEERINKKNSESYIKALYNDNDFFSKRTIPFAKNEPYSCLENYQDSYKLSKVKKWIRIENPTYGRCRRCHHYGLVDDVKIGLY